MVGGLSVQGDRWVPPAERRTGDRWPGSGHLETKTLPKWVSPGSLRFDGYHVIT